MKCDTLFLDVAISRRLDSGERDILFDNKRFIFSDDKMTWNDGETYCGRKSGRIASILDAKTLSAVLEKMTELGMYVCG